MARRCSAGLWDDRLSLLLDSHILLWYVDADPRLSSAAAYEIRKAKDLYFSVASLWELSLKMHTGKMERRDVESFAMRLGCRLIAVTAAHANATLDLPRVHRDPFDHMLLAQARVEGLTLVTHDRMLGDYGVPVLLV